MITKGTQEYKKAQQIAGEIESAAKTTRYSSMSFSMYYETLGHFIDKVKKLNCFAAQVAETIDSRLGKGFTVASVSSKQAWILACAAVENGVEFEMYDCDGKKLYE